MISELVGTLKFLRCSSSITLEISTVSFEGRFHLTLRVRIEGRLSWWWVHGRYERLCDDDDSNNNNNNSIPSATNRYFENQSFVPVNVTHLRKSVIYERNCSSREHRRSSDFRKSIIYEIPGEHFRK